MKALLSSASGARKKNTGNAGARIYLDHAAAAPLEESVLAAMQQAARGLFAHPSSIHKDGVRARATLEASRAQIAGLFEVHADEITFTGSGTESDNLAILGSVVAAVRSGAFSKKAVHVITTAIEHPAVLKACDALEKSGVSVTRLPVGTDGLVDVKELRAALRPETVLVSVGYANSEIGTVQPLREIAKAIRHHKKEMGDPNATYPLFHTDACQAVPYLSIRVPELGVDMLSANGTKLGGPRGIGLLYARRGTPLAPVIHGGGQENGLRSGTEDSASIKGLEVALAEARARADSETKRLAELRDICLAELRERFPSCRINGSTSLRLPHNVHASFPGITSELLVLELDAKGISVSAGSACGSGVDDTSHVMEALYGASARGEWGSLRATFGRATREKDIFVFLDALEEVIEKYEPWKR